LCGRSAATALDPGSVNIIGTAKREPEIDSRAIAASGRKKPVAECESRIYIA